MAWAQLGLPAVSYWSDTAPALASLNDPDVLSAQALLSLFGRSLVRLSFSPLSPAKHDEI